MGGLADVPPPLGVLGPCIAATNLDALIADEGLPQLFPVALDQVRRSTPSADVGVHDRQNVVLVGWSLTHWRMIGRSWLRDVAAAAFVATDIAPYHIAPWHSSFERLPDPSNWIKMAQLAEAQCAYLNIHEPDVAAGGRFVVARLDREGMKISAIRELASSRARQ